MKAIHLEIGNDIGNSAHKIIINGDECKQQPSCNVMVSKPNFAVDVSETEIIKNIWDNLCISIDSPSVKNGMYLIGRYAVTSGIPTENLLVGLDRKSEHDLPIVNTLGNIAAYIIATSQKDGVLDKDAFKVQVDMATAIPVTQHTEEAARGIENRFMKGKHNVTVYIGQKRQVSVEITFDFVYCTHEGAPVTFAIQFDRKGKWRHDSIFEQFNKYRNSKGKDPVTGEYFKDKKILHADIGDGTTELSVTEGVRPTHVFGVNHGVGHAMEAALQEFNNSINIPDSPRQFMSDVIKDKSHRYYARAHKALLPHLLNEISQIEKGFKQQLVKTKGLIDVAMVYSGGSIICQPELEERLRELCEERDIELFYVPAEYAVDLNAEGLYRFVLMPIYQSLKSTRKESASSK